MRYPVANSVQNQGRGPGDAYSIIKCGDNGMEIGVPGISDCSDGEPPREWSKEFESDSGGV